MQLFVAVKQLTVAEALRARNWNQADLAERTGLNKSTVSRLVSGDITNPGIDTVRKLELAGLLRRGEQLVFGQVMEKAS